MLKKRDREENTRAEAGGLRSREKRPGGSRGRSENLRTHVSGRQNKAEVWRQRKRYEG